MARLFIILLIALLPLRGWTVERMTIHMAAGEPVSAMAADCPSMMQAATTDADSDHAGDSSHRACQSCQLCMALSSQAAPGITAFLCATARSARPQADRFTSAFATSVSKPPIL